jgi:GNAT superfamily N-acetyltransferase
MNCWLRREASATCTKGRRGWGPGYTAAPLMRSDCVSGSQARTGSEFRGLFGLLQNDDGEIVGGALGNIWGDWYFLDVLWVDRPLRGQDNGQRMLAAAEQHASERGCAGAHLDAASFQARPFYENSAILCSVRSRIIPSATLTTS